MKISWNIKTKCVSDLLLTVRSSNMKNYIFHYVVITFKTYVYINFNNNNENLEIFSLHITGYLNIRKTLPICMFVGMASGKCDLHIRGLLEKYPTFGREKETGLLGALDT